MHKYYVRFLLPFSLDDAFALAHLADVALHQQLNIDLPLSLSFFTAPFFSFLLSGLLFLFSLLPSICLVIHSLI